MSDAWRMQDKARRVLQAAAIEAYGRAGVYVIMGQVMSRANFSDPKEFRTVAQYLEGKGWIAEADSNYGIFVLTPEGVDTAMN